jgi:hypothetical protein
MNQPITLDPDQAEDLHRLLGTVEDWLLRSLARLFVREAQQ